MMLCAKIMELRLQLLKLFPENYWLLFFLDMVYKQTYGKIN